MGKYSTKSSDNCNNIPINTTKSVFKRQTCNGKEGDKFQKEWQTLKKSADFVKRVDLALEGEKIQTLAEGTSFNNSQYRDLYQENEQHGKKVISPLFVSIFNSY